MAIANLVVRIAADIADFEKNIAGVERTLQRTGRNLESIGSRLTRGLTVPIVAAVGVVTKAAVDFESSFAGIVKTVNDATDSMGNLTPVGKQLAQGMRDLAKTIPVNVNELNRIGEAAGQLGIKSSQILDFTKVMAELGVTTNLSSDQAATSLARFANIMDATRKDAGTFEFDRLGSTIVALGNSFETTEAEIVDFGLRIAGAGKIAGLTESQVLAIGAAMSSVGVQAEAGGTSVQKVLNQMTEAVATNNKQLEQFAATAGLSAKAFADAFRTDAGEAFARFVKGLGEEGDRAFTTLDNLKLGNERVIRAFLSLANAGDKLTDTLRVGGEAWRENTALTKEAEQRFKTTASQFTLLKNQLQDVAITLGQALLPVLNDFIRSSRPMVDSLAEMAKKFGELPQGIRTAAFAFLGLLASLGPVVFIVSQVTQAAAGLAAGFRLFIPDVSKAALAAKDASGVFSGVLGTLARYPGIIALAAAAIVSITSTMDSFSDSTEQGVLHLLGIIPAVGLLEVAVDKLGSAFPRLRDVFDDVVSIVKNSMILAFREAERAIDALQTALGNAIDIMARSFQPIVEAFGLSWERFSRVLTTIVIPTIKTVAAQFITSLPPIQSFLLLLSTVPGFGEIEGALDRVAKRMQALVDEAGKSAGSVRQLGVAFSGGLRSADAWSDTLDGAKKSLTSASTAMVSFGSGVASNVVNPLRLGSAALEKVADQAKKAAAAIKSAISDSLSGFRLGGIGSIPGIEVDLSKLITIIPPTVPDIREMILRGFERASTGPLTNLPGIALDLTKIFPPPKPGFWESYLTSGLDQALGDLQQRLGGIGGTIVGLARTVLSGFAQMAEAAKNFGKSVAQSAAAVVSMASNTISTVFALVQAYEALSGAADERVGTALRRQFIEASGGLDELRAAAALAGVSLDGLLDPDRSSDFTEREIRNITRAIEEQQRAMDAYDLTWRDFNATVAQTQVDQIARTLIRDFQLLSQQGANPTRIIEGMSGALNQLIIDAVNTGTRIPGALRPMIESMIRAGLVTDEAARAMLGLAQDSLPSLADITAAAERYGLTLDQLGPKVQQISINEQAQQIIADWKLLVDEAGAGVETVALAMREAAQDMVTTALSMGLTIPEGMRPILQVLVDMGLLVDQNGDKLENLDDINFGRDLTQAIEDLIAKLDELIDAFSTVGTTAEDAWRRARNGAEITGRAIPRGAFDDFADEAEDAGRRIEDTFSDLDFPPIIIPIEWDVPDLPSGNIPALAHGGVVTRPTLALVGESGPEAVVPLSQLGSHISGPTASTSTFILEADGRTLAEVTVPYIPGVVRRYGLV